MTCPQDAGIPRRPVDPEEELRLMAQEVRDYVEAVLNSLAANIPKVSTYLCVNSFILLSS
jgi:dynamin GTPase